MKTIVRSATAALMFALLCSGAPLAHAASTTHSAPVSPSYFNLCAHPLTKWLCP